MIIDTSCLVFSFVFFFFFKQKTAYDMRISDWSSDVCSSDLLRHPVQPGGHDRDQRPDGELEHPGECVEVGELRVRGGLVQRPAERRECDQEKPDQHPDPGPDTELRRDQDREQQHDRPDEKVREEKRPVGQGSVSTCRTRWSPVTEKKKK